MSFRINRANSFSTFNKLRWTTIGYHYNWTAKEYDEADFSEMPPDVVNISKLVASVLNYNDYRPQAGIVNYYHLNSTLSVHQDYSEVNQEAPLISMSLGSSAIFLIGDENRASKPSALYLKSGDIVIMSGKSRLAYHAVPKILANADLESTYFTYAEKSSDLSSSSSTIVNDSEWSSIFDYIKINRINLNIRQVYF